MPSTVIRSYYYEKENHSLVVVFTSGIVYRYREVPEEMYHQMKESFAKGVFLNKFIKGKYEFERLEE